MKGRPGDEGFLAMAIHHDAPTLGKGEKGRRVKRRNIIPISLEVEKGPLKSLTKHNQKRNAQRMKEPKPLTTLDERENGEENPEKKRFWLR